MKNLKYVGRMIDGVITLEYDATLDSAKFLTLINRIDDVEPLDYDDGYELIKHDTSLNIYDFENFYKIDNYLIIHDVDGCYIVLEVKDYEINHVSLDNVAFALALRIVDEWDGLDDNKPLLQNALETMLKENPKICKSLWDNGIIEADYFEDLD
jgi:hypothetical protein